MCCTDPEGELFMKKVTRYGVTPEKLRRIQPKLTLTKIDGQVSEIRDGYIQESSLYRVNGVSGGKLIFGKDNKSVILPGMLITDSVLLAFQTNPEFESLRIQWKT
jgi:hypothetical protein